MKIAVFVFALIQMAIGLLFIVEAEAVPRLTLGTISFGLGSVCFAIAVVIGKLDEIRSNQR
ncbi:hypothetical protein GR158_04250 [Shinella sp. AETb1-6]|uniref:hypothetical protein n=1 Tax=Shinella sp. AETb1-6 TaxID=2692210 RepID=UPI0013684203|nr:hypothetical protein [Shinella sp. AETb1-6]MXN50316.1 hypothetical protein [Shinella sp. AETb1-6]